MNFTEFPSTVMVREDGISDALLAKIITMVCLFSISMLVGCVPLLISLKYDWFTKGDDISSNRLVRSMLAFGGGVLFETSFMHLLPEVSENIELLQDAGEIEEFPIYLAGLIVCSGFFMMYIIEELVHLYINHRGKNKDTTFNRVLSVRLSGKANGEDAKEVEELKVHNHNGGHFGGVTQEGEDGVLSALRGLLIVLALSIHELFEGLAVGLESSVGNVWYMFGAVSAHKYIIAFCIAVELLVAKTKRWLSVLYIFVFSFTSALGIGIGILLVGGQGAADAGLVSVVLQGIACGTLVYVVFFEIWKRNSGFRDLLCGMLGFVVMVALELLVEWVTDA